MSPEAVPVQRVLFVPEARASALETLPHLELGESREGTWVAAGDEAFFVLLDRDAEPSLLYFTRDEYDRAMRGLDPEQVPVVVHHRRDNWSPNALSNGTYELFRIERGCLSLLASARANVQGEMRSRYDMLANGTAAFLTSLVGEGRYDDVALTDMLIIALEGGSSLLTELDLAKEDAAAGAQTHLAALESAERAFAATLQSALVRRDRPEFGTALPYAEAERVYFAAPRNADLLGALYKDDIYSEWRDGLVLAWRLRKLPRIEGSGRSVTVLYLSKADYLDDIAELIRPQLEREWTERLDKGHGRGPDALHDHLNARLLDQHLLRRNLLTVAGRHDAALAESIAKDVARESELLLEALAIRPTWLPSGASPDPRSLRRAAGEAVEDALFFAEWSLRGEQFALHNRFMKLAATADTLRKEAEGLP